MTGKCRNSNAHCNTTIGNRAIASKFVDEGGKPFHNDESF